MFSGRGQVSILRGDWIGFYFDFGKVCVLSLCCGVVACVGWSAFFCLGTLYRVVWCGVMWCLVCGFGVLCVWSWMYGMKSVYPCVSE